MSISVLSEPPVTTTPGTFPGTDSNDPHVGVPLRTELFLLAHDDDTGRPHLDQRALCLGLAGAVLLDLWRTGRVLISKAYQARDGFYTADPGRITITDPTLYGDPITDAAMVLLRRADGPKYVTDFIRRFATPGLYDRVFGDLLATGILRRIRHHRFRWFARFTKDRYRPDQPTYAVRARARLRSLAKARNGTDRPAANTPDVDALSLAGLVTALGLARYLHLGEPAALHARLANSLHQSYDSTIRDVTNAINPHSRPHRR
jgi:hypothetical protein